MLAWRLLREQRGEGGGPGNTVNPRVGCTLQQRVHRRSGGTRRGGEKPRGRNETPSMARGVRRRGVSAPNREWTGQSENRRRGPRGGDAAKSTDGRRAEARHHAGLRAKASTSRGEGDAELAEGSGGRPGGNTGRPGERRGSRQRWRGNAARACGCPRVSARVREDLERPTGNGQGEGGSGEGQRLATVHSERIQRWSNLAPRHLRTTTCTTVPDSSGAALA